MEKDIPLYRMIYHKVVNRVLTGYYQKGDRLASAQKIREQYGCSLNSVRQAMRLLEQDGYIRLEERKAPVVVADPSDPKYRALRRDNFLRRKHAHMDAYRMLALFVPQLAWQGAQRCRKEELEGLAQAAAQSARQAAARTGLLCAVQDFSLALVRRSGNLLAADLFFQVRGFDELGRIVLPAQTPAEDEAELAASVVERLAQLAGAGRQDDFCWLLACCCRSLACELALEIGRYAPEEAAPETQVAFLWYADQRPVPLYRQVAYDLLRFAQRSLAPGEFFPSEASLMQRYGVSAVTVRSALATLNALGLARTFNGRGTQFWPEPAADGEYGRLLKEYFDSMELLAAAANGLARLAAPTLRPRAQALCEQAAAYRSRHGLWTWTLEQVLPAVPNEAVRNSFGRLYDRIIFGLALKPTVQSGAAPAHFERIYRRLCEGLRSLDGGDVPAFCDAFAAISRDSLESSRGRLRALCQESEQWKAVLSAI